MKAALTFLPSSSLPTLHVPTSGVLVSAWELILCPASLPHGFMQKPVFTHTGLQKHSDRLSLLKDGASGRISVSLESSPSAFPPSLVFRRGDFVQMQSS